MNPVISISFLCILFLAIGRPVAWARVQEPNGMYRRLTDVKHTIGHDEIITESRSCDGYECDAGKQCCYDPDIGLRWCDDSCDTKTPGVKSKYACALLVWILCPPINCAYYEIFVDRMFLLILPCRSTAQHQFHR